MNFQNAPNKVSVCKKDVCVNLYGDLAKAVTIVLAFAIAAYGVSLLARAIK
jgi:hypothetical protein